MGNLLYIVKTMAIIQLLIIITFVSLMYLTKAYLRYQEKQTKNKKRLIVNLLESIANGKDGFSQAAIKFLKKEIFLVITVLPSLEEHKHKFRYADSFKSNLISKILIPVAKKFAYSRNWFKRYIAVRCYSYGFEESDEEAILKLLRDHITLVSINSAMVATKFFNEKLTNNLIDIFSAGRRLQQSLYAEMIAKKGDAIAIIIFNRLDKEQNLYVKAFCYRLLSRLEDKTIFYPNAKDDVLSDNLELKLSALRYVASCDYPSKIEIVFKLTNDPHWEVRAVVANILGQILSKESTHF